MGLTPNDDDLRAEYWGELGKLRRFDEVLADAAKVEEMGKRDWKLRWNEAEANELEYARLVARTFRTDHHEITLSPEDFFSALPRLIWHEDEPLAHPASVPLYFVSRLAAEKVKVVLTGEGSDELHAGYSRYRTTVYNMALGARYQSLMPVSIKAAIRKLIAEMPAAWKAKQKLLRTFLTLPADIESIYFDNFAVFPRAMQTQLFTPQTRERVGTIDPYARVRGFMEGTDATSLLDRLLYADIKTYLHELLMKQDQMSMATSVESRVPFLDHKLVEFTAQLPERLKLRGWTTKYILRKSMKGILPEQVLLRRKMGFPVPLGSWFRHQYRSVIDEYVLSDRTMNRGLFDQTFVRDLVAQHQSETRDHSERLWSLINFEIWLRQFIDEDMDASQFIVAEDKALLQV